MLQNINDDVLTFFEGVHTKSLIRFINFHFFLDAFHKNSIFMDSVLLVFIFCVPTSHCNENFDVNHEKTKSGEDIYSFFNKEQDNVSEIIRNSDSIYFIKDPSL